MRTAILPWRASSTDGRAASPTALGSCWQRSCSSWARNVLPLRASRPWTSGAHLGLGRVGRVLPQPPRAANSAQAPEGCPGACSKRVPCVRALAHPDSTAEKQARARLSLGAPSLGHCLLHMSVHVESRVVPPTMSVAAQWWQLGGSQGPAWSSKQRRGDQGATASKPLAPKPCRHSSGPPRWEGLHTHVQQRGRLQPGRLWALRSPSILAANT